MEPTGKLRHVVLFGFHDTVSEQQRKDVVDRFRALKELVPGIEAFECGVNVSPEGLAQGHTHIFALTFATESARDAYLPHPHHQEFVTWVGPFIAKALVIDYWTS